MVQIVSAKDVAPHLSQRIEVAHSLTLLVGQAWHLWVSLRQLCSMQCTGRSLFHAVVLTVRVQAGECDSGRAWCK